MDSAPPRCLHQDGLPITHSCCTMWSWNEISVSFDNTFIRNPDAIPCCYLDFSPSDSCHLLGPKRPPKAPQLKDLQNKNLKNYNFPETPQRYKLLKNFQLSQRKKREGDISHTLFAPARGLTPKSLYIRALRINKVCVCMTSSSCLVFLLDGPLNISSISS